MAVSQWLFPWSPPTHILTDMAHQFDNTNSETLYKWDNFKPKRTFRPVQVPLESVSGNKYHARYKQMGRHHDDFAQYTSTYRSGPKDNERVQLTGLTLWLTMLSLARSQSMISDTETPPFSTLYKWKYIDFEFPSLAHRRHAISSELYIPRNVIPLGIEIYDFRIFITLPKWRQGVPATLATVTRLGGTSSPSLKPYPSWDFHKRSDDVNKCTGLVSVFRIAADPCGRLWVLDSGQIDIQDTPKEICPPSLVLFDLTKDRFMARYTIPEDYVLQDSLFTNLVIDSQNDCSDVHVYIADTWRFGLIVFRQRDQRFWRFTHNLFFPDPIASNYYLHDLNFRWTDGILGLALSSTKLHQNKILFFHPMSSTYEFFVETNVLQDPLRVNDSANEFNIVGESRSRLGQASASAIDRNGVMYFGLVTKDCIGCWDTNKPYNKKTLGIVALNTETLIFPNDMKVDSGNRQLLWVLSNRLPLFQADILDIDDYNFRLLFVSVEEAMRGTVCDPTVKEDLDGVTVN